MDSDLERAITIVREAIWSSPVDRRMALIALDIVAGPARAVEELSAVPSWFTIPTRDGGTELCAQNEHCERQFSVEGANLREAICAAGHTVRCNRVAAEKEGANTDATSSTGER